MICFSVDCFVVPPTNDGGFWLHGSKRRRVDQHDRIKVNSRSPFASSNELIRLSSL